MIFSLLDRTSSIMKSERHEVAQAICVRCSPVPCLVARSAMQSWSFFYRPLVPGMSVNGKMGPQMKGHIIGLYSVCLRVVLPFPCFSPGSHAWLPGVVGPKCWMVRGIRVIQCGAGQVSFLPFFWPLCLSKNWTLGTVPAPNGEW